MNISELTGISNCFCVPGRRGPQGGGMGPPSADGWNMVGGQSRTPFKSIDRSIDPTKMKISKV